MYAVRVLAACLLGMTVWGCSLNVPEGPAPGVRVRDPRAPQAGIRYNTVAIIDKSLENWDGRVFDPSFIEYLWPQQPHKRSKIAVESTNSRRTPTGTLEAWAILRNRTDYALQIEGRIHFFDADRVPVEPPTAWQRVYLPPQSVDTYKECSTKSSEVTYYYIEIREGR